VSVAPKAKENTRALTLLAFVSRKSMQTAKEPVKVSLRLAFARP
jgi:hypothetical protein